VIPLWAKSVCSGFYYTEEVMERVSKPLHSLTCSLTQKIIPFPFTGAIRVNRDKRSADLDHVRRQVLKILHPCTTSSLLLHTKYKGPAIFDMARYPWKVMYLMRSMGKLSIPTLSQESVRSMSGSVTVQSQSRIVLQ